MNPQTYFLRISSKLLSFLHQSPGFSPIYNLKAILNETEELKPLLAAISTIFNDGSDLNNSTA